MVIDALRDQEQITGPLVEIGSGSGIVILTVMQDRRDFHLAVDINYDAAHMTRENAKLNGDDNLQVICGDLSSAIRREGLPGIVIFNPPYLPEDQEVDPYSPKYELQQLVGGKQGFEVVSRLLHQLEPGDYTVYLVISSLATNPLEFSEMHGEWRSFVVRSENMGFETIWLMRFD
jgi:methylase of polypeptide subunit release factors